jgi:hypothetical protein
MLHVSKVHWRIVLPLIGVTLIVVAIILGYRWYHERKNRDPLSDLGPGQYQPEAVQPAEILPLPATNEP